MIRYMHCRDCGTDLVDPLDTLNGFCWDCRELNSIEARKTWCVVQEYGKGPYQLVTTSAAPTTLKQTNQKSIRT